MHRASRVHHPQARIGQQIGIDASNLCVSACGQRVKSGMLAQRLFRSRVGDDPRGVEAQELLAGVRGPPFETGFSCDVDQACGDEDVVKAGPRSSSIEAAAVNADVQTAAPFRLLHIRCNALEVALDFSSELLPTTWYADHCGELADVRQQGLKTAHLAQIENVEPSVLEALDVASVDEVVDEDDVGPKLDDGFDVAGAFHADLVVVDLGLLAFQRVPTDGKQAAWLDDLDQYLIGDRARARDPHVLLRRDKSARRVPYGVGVSGGTDYCLAL